MPSQSEGDIGEIFTSSDEPFTSDDSGTQESTTSNADEQSTDTFSEVEGVLCKSRLSIYETYVLNQLKSCYLNTMSESSLQTFCQKSGMLAS